MKKTFIAFGLFLAVACAFLATQVYRARQARSEELRAAQAAHEARLQKEIEQPAPVVTPTPAAESSPPVEPAPEPAAESPTPKTTTPGKTKSAPSVPKGAPNQGGKQLVDGMARVALTFVGADPEAEQYWFEAINDPSLPPNERQDLIEDLNEDGIADPKHPTLDDLPLILNRIRIIELVAWSAMDQVNADAFMEAYKDLVNLAEVAQGGGEPVK